MTAEDIRALRKLWQEAFGDPDAFVNAFFTLGFSPGRCHCIWEDGQPVSVLYWFDCGLETHKLAYIYGAATRKSHRGQGLGSRLFRETHEILRAQDYRGVILVPGEESLFAFYRKLGYRAGSTVSEFSSAAGDAPLPLHQIDASEYARLRGKYLPEGGVTQSAHTLTFLHSICKLYAGEDFLLAGECIGGHFFAQELLGNTNAAPAILRTLGCAKGRFRAPGKDRTLSMFLPLTENCPVPTYFAPALD